MTEHLRQRIAHLWGLLTWLGRDALWRFRKPVLTVVAGNAAGLFCEFAAYKVLFHYARAVEQDNLIEIMGITLWHPTSPQALILTAVATLVLLGLSGVFIYAAGKTTILLWRMYQEFCTERAYALVSYLPHPACELANQYLSLTALAKLGRRQAHYCGRLVRLAARMLLPVGRMLISGAVLFIINPLFSGIIFLLLCAAQIFLHRNNMAAAQASHRFERHSPEASRQRERFLKAIWLSAAQLTPDAPLIRGIFSSKPVRKYQDAYFGRFISIEKTRLLLNSLTSVSIVLILIIAGVGAISGAWSWSIFLAYLVALRYFLRSLMAVGAGVTRGSRFYPQVNEYYRFVRDAQKASEAPSSPQRFSRISIRIPSLMGDDRHLILHPGQVVGLLHPGAIHRGLVKLLWEAMEPTPPFTGSPFWFLNEPPPEQLTLREWLGLPKSLEEEKFRELLVHTASGGNGKLRAIPLALDSSAAESVSLPEHQPILPLLKLTAALYSGRPIILFPEQDWHALLRCGCTALLEQLRERLVILVSSDMLSRDVADAHTVLLLSREKELYGWATQGWLIAHPEVWQEFRREYARQKARVSGFIDEDDDDEDDDL
ncbi:MAG: hypothetical protein D6681_14715 [Calditrichaeota bacterium]|nr:MAG: hypothetical protein D6681_14715 [Calditrichota bacterium]